VTPTPLTAMGRRSRKRAAEGTSTRAERDAARSDRAHAAATSERSERPRPGRTRIEDRPTAFWGSAPLGELVTLVGIAVMVWGFLSRSNARIGIGLGVAALAGLELALREHLAGYRSHTTLLSGVAAFVVVTILALGPGPKVLGFLVAIGAVVFAACFLGFRWLFKSRSGGTAFR
jgi:hypothetical protein